MGPATLPMTRLRVVAVGRPPLLKVAFMPAESAAEEASHRGSMVPGVG